MKKLRCLISFALTALLLTACSGKQDSAAPSSEPASSSENTDNNNTEKQTGTALGVDYPKKPITLINSSSAGSPADIMARQIAQSIEEIYDVTVTVENVTGGSGANMFAEINNRSTDGYTIGTVTASQIAALCNGLDEQFPLDTFTFVSNVQTDPYCLAVSADSKFNTLEDLIEYGKSNPDSLLISGQGTGSALHLSALQLGSEGDFTFTWLPTDGGSDTVANLLGGNCDAGFAAPTTVNQYVKAGQLKMLAITGNDSVSSAEGIPTFSEKGYDLQLTQYRGFYVNSKTSPEICTMISDMIHEASQTDSFKKYMEEQLLDDGYMDISTFNDYALSDYNTVKTLSEKLLSK
ncbi:tripartite tricarboxylate transporter substrate binding protein [Lachnospiraceae bacterium 62-35]